ncbi:hypothetical protein [uncultured Draconibacterium sp.]|uniref:hypothetical protein n=1 Tax=uncultured Draconibacterium sp. TaxID=1573823 RepID=UPI002AA7443D|nr:hypothetical protein [uncultured Draconibacterium sp.]
MKLNATLNKIKSYLKELTIVTFGVFIALAISNYKEYKQARDYYMASIETVNKEVETNYEMLKGIIEAQSELLDTINKFSTNQITLSDLIIDKAGGLTGASLNNSGLEFYKNNQINSVDFEMMSRLIRMESLTKLIDKKMDKLMDYLYPNLFVDSEESKMLTSLYLSNLLGTEIQLMESYKNFIDEFIDEKHSAK